MGPLESDRIHFWRYSASVDASHTDSGALECELAMRLAFPIEAHH